MQQIQGRLVPVVFLDRHDELPRALALFHAKSGVADWSGPRVVYAGGSVNVAFAGGNVRKHTQQNGNLGWGVLGVDEASSAIFHVTDLQNLVQDGVKHADGAEEVHHGYVVDIFQSFDDQNFEICGATVKKHKVTKACCYYVCAAARGRCPRGDPARRPNKAPPRADGTKKRPVSDDGERFSAQDDEKIWKYVTERGGPGDWKGAVPLFGGRFTDSQIGYHYTKVVKPSRDPTGRLESKRGTGMWTDEADNAIVAAFNAAGTYNVGPKGWNAMARLPPLRGWSAEEIRLRFAQARLRHRPWPPATTDALTTAVPTTTMAAPPPTTTTAVPPPPTTTAVPTTTRGHSIRAAIDRGDGASAVLALFKGANVVVSGALWKDLRVASEERIIYVLRYMLEAHCKRRGRFTKSTDVVIASAEEMSNAGKAGKMGSSASRARSSQRAVLVASTEFFALLTAGVWATSLAHAVAAFRGVPLRHEPPTTTDSFRGAVVSLTGSVDNAVVEAMETAGATVGRFDVDDNVTYLVAGSVFVGDVYESDCSKKQRDAWSRGIPVVEVGDVVALLEVGDALVGARAVTPESTDAEAPPPPLFDDVAAAPKAALRPRAKRSRAKRSRAEPPAPVVSPAGSFAAPAPDDDVVPAEAVPAPDASMDDASPVEAPSPAAPSPVRAPPSPAAPTPRSGPCAEITSAPLDDVAKIAKVRELGGPACDEKAAMKYLRRANGNLDGACNLAIDANEAAAAAAARKSTAGQRNAKRPRAG